MARLAFAGGAFLMVQGDRDEVAERLKAGEWVLMLSTRNEVWVNPAAVAYVVGDEVFEQAHEASEARAEELIGRLADALGIERPAEGGPAN